MYQPCSWQRDDRTKTTDPHHHHSALLFDLERVKEKQASEAFIR
jgi:hypothetical protein